MASGVRERKHNSMILSMLTQIASLSVQEERIPEILRWVV
jgi:hypothetical protein